jgi:hypothetical protein
MLPTNTHAVAASNPAAAASGLAQTPALLLPLVLLILLLARLPADARARAAAVCRAWRAAAADAAAWTEVDLTRAGGLTCGIINPAVILAALAPRLSKLRVLRMEWCEDDELDVDDFLPAVLRLVRDGHVPALKELHHAGAAPVDTANPLYRKPDYEPVLRALLAEAPALTLVELDQLLCDGVGAIALLPLPQLRVKDVTWRAPQHEPVATCEAVLAALESQGSLQTLEVHETFNSQANPELLTRVVDIALARHLRALTLYCLKLSGGLVPQLARLLREGTSLRSLTLSGPDSLEDDGGVALFADALRANTTLQELHFTWMCSWIDDQAAGPAVCAALHGHPSLQFVGFMDTCDIPEQVINFSLLDASLAGLLLANAPALQMLKLEFFSEDGVPSPTLSRTFNALAGNTHLRMLHTWYLSPDASFVRDSLLPAVRANTSLLELDVAFDDEESLDPELQRAVDEAMELVKTRAAAA